MCESRKKEITVPEFFFTTKENHEITSVKTFKALLHAKIIFTVTVVESLGLFGLIVKGQ